MSGSHDTKTIIGRTVDVSFPEFGIEGVASRVDTGAMTSSIHCKDVVEITEDGESVLCFTLLDEEHPEFTGSPRVAHTFEKRTIRSSNGDEQERYVIESEIVVAGQTLITEFTLADRESMSFPVLIGRRLLAGHFIVDVEIERGST